MEACKLDVMPGFLFTSEAVTEGHPDKVCDRISDAILDDILEHDPNGRVACETVCTTGMVFVTGEISSSYKPDYQKIVRKTLCEIGYDSPESGFDGNTCAVLVSIDEQSEDIARGTNDEIGGAGDQGMMFGYACRETDDLMPLPITLANRLAYRLAEARKDGSIPFILPDGKTQVTVRYNDFQNPYKLDTIILSTQHKDKYPVSVVKEYVLNHVIQPVLEATVEEKRGLDVSSFDLFVNPTGRFVKGGPAADTGLTGRKIIADTYGGFAPHGGGAFSGKDPTKVDRSAAYMARYIAKHVVASGIAEKCLIQLAYSIGIAEPVSLMVNTYGTNKVHSERITRAIRECFDLTPKGIIQELDLRKPVYKLTSSYGHFGTVGVGYRSWEQVHMDKCSAIVNAL